MKIKVFFFFLDIVEFADSLDPNKLPHQDLNSLLSSLNFEYKTAMMKCFI